MHAKKRTQISEEAEEEPPNTAERRKRTKEKPR